MLCRYIVLCRYNQSLCFVDFCRSALQATAFMVSHLKSLGLECSVDNIGPALAFSELVQRSNSTFARNFRQCLGKL